MLISNIFTQMDILHGKRGDLFHLCSPLASRAGQDGYRSEIEKIVFRSAPSMKRKRTEAKTLSASVKKKSTYDYISLADAVHHVQKQVNVYGVSTIAASTTFIIRLYFILKFARQYLLAAVRFRAA